MLRSKTTKTPPHLSGAFVSAAFLVALFLCLFIPARNLLEFFWGSYVKLIPDLLIAFLFVWYAIETRLKLRFRLPDLFFLAFLALAGINTVLLQHAGIMRFVFQVRSIGVYYALYFVLRNVPLEKAHVKKLLRTLQAVTAVLLVLGIVEKVFSKTVLFPSEWAESILYASNFTRIYSTFNNPNTYGLFLVLVFFFGVFCEMYLKIRTSPFFHGVLFAGLLLSMSRSSLIAFGIGCVLVLLYLLAREGKGLDFKRLLIDAVIILLLGFALYRGAIFGAGAYANSLVERDPAQGDSMISRATKIETGDRFNQTLSDEEKKLSESSGRIFSLKKGLEIFPQYPLFGTGFGTYGSAASMNYESVFPEEEGIPQGFYSDNEYIVIVVETGAVGTLLFAAFLLSVLWEHRKNFGKFCFCILIGWFGLFYNVFEVQIGAMLFWAFLSLPLPRYRPKGVPEPGEEIDIQEIRRRQTEIVKVFDAYCRENGIRYFLYGGTLLGAVRHKGFIPWDDDIDLVLPRPDYERFLALVKEKPLGGTLTAIDYRSSPYYPYPFAKIHDTSTVCDLAGFDRRLALGVWIDLFPMDGLPEEETEQDRLIAALQEKILKVKRLGRTFSAGETVPEFLKNLARAILRSVSRPRRLVEELDRAAQEYPFETSPYIGVIAYCRGKNNVISRAGFLDTVRLPFETEEFDAPGTYETYLANLYGADYMQLPPESERETHSYHAYLRKEADAQ